MYDSYDNDSSEQEILSRLVSKVKTIVGEFMGAQTITPEFAADLQRRTDLSVQTLSHALQSIPKVHVGDVVDEAAETYSKACMEALTDLSLEDAMTVCTFLEAIRVSFARALSQKVAVDRVIREVK